MGRQWYDGLDEKLFGDAFQNSNGDEVKASRLGNFRYSSITYTKMWRRMELVTGRKSKYRKRYAFKDIPESIG